MNGSLTLNNLSSVDQENFKDDQKLIIDHFGKLGERLHNWGFINLQQLSNYIERKVYIDMSDRL